MDELKDILKRVRQALGERDYAVMHSVVETLDYLTHLAKDKQAAEIYRILVSSKSEKTRDVLRVLDLERDAEEAAATEGKSKDDAAAPTAETDAAATKEDVAEPVPTATNPTSEDKPSDKNKRKGHGRNGAGNYTAARRIPVYLESMKAGDRCPCGMGNLYDIDASPLIRIVGQAPIHADIYDLQKLRCNTCGDIFTAEAPEGVGTEKYDATSCAMVALFKYGSGFPFYRMERLQANLGIPLPASTQWEMVLNAAQRILPVFNELIRQASDGDVLYNDDTSVKILEFLKHNRVIEDKDFPKRTGIFTTGIVSTRDGRKIALFFSGRKHAGENLADVLAQRARELPSPIQMCDASSRNLPRQLKVILANCLTHGRRQFVEAAANFPEECAYILETLGKVYHNEAITRERGMTPEARLTFHQAESGPLMDQMKNWFALQIDEKRCEPNSGLGSAIAYMQTRWDELTLFLRIPGAPLDSNIVERALKRAILHRKTALFYKTKRGAGVGDLFMSLIHTCQLSEVNAFEYLTVLQQNTDHLAREPGQWMPWNYVQTLANINAPASVPN
ncbi:MAG TPA: IS66 family transposase [Terriglobia bacterium]|nr:IS66 family transposase [Terriglobia bacterium]